MKIKLSKSQWETVGKKAGWIKQSGQFIPDDGFSDGGERYTDDELNIMNKEESQSIESIEKMRQLNATDAQIESAKKFIERYKREPTAVGSYIGGDGVIMLNFGNIMIGIEKDGYAHS